MWHILPIGKCRCSFDTIIHLLVVKSIYFKQLCKNRTFSSHPLLHIREAKNCNDND
nr:MAG TPA: hypothetical protein [Caudoviricetes sp.]